MLEHKGPAWYVGSSNWSQVNRSDDLRIDDGPVDKQEILPCYVGFNKKKSDLK